MTSWFHFLSGATMMGFLVAGAFFFRFWVKTKDRIFVFFASAFFTMALERLVLISMHGEDELRTLVYVFRLIAFSLIIYGIADNNRQSGSP